MLTSGVDTHDEPWPWPWPASARGVYHASARRAGFGAAARLAIGLTGSSSRLAHTASAQALALVSGATPIPPEHPATSPFAPPMPSCRKLEISGFVG